MSSKTLLDRVELITKRPDARALACDKLNALILQIITESDYPQELVETTIANPTPTNHIATISCPSVRKIEYITANDKPLTNVKPRNALMNNGCPVLNSWYRSGSTLVLAAEKAFPHIRIGYYPPHVYIPDASDASHWLIDEQELMIYYGVAAAVFLATGDDQSYTMYMNEYRLLKAQFRRGLRDTEEV